MKWIHDSNLITRQVIVWALLFLFWGAITYVILRYVPANFVLIALGIMAIPFLIQFFFSDKLVLKSMGAHIITEHDSPKVYRMVQKLAQSANLPMPKVAMVSTPMANAFATGRGKNHSVVGVTTGLLDCLDDDEVETVIAHELSHIKNNDVATLTIAGFLATVSTIALKFWLIGLSSGSRSEGGLTALARLLILLAGCLILGIIYLFTMIIVSLLSRYRELAADRGSVIITGKPNVLIRALEKITNYDGYYEPENGNTFSGSHNLYYIIPLAATGFLSGLFSTHPSLSKRISNIEKFALQRDDDIRRYQDDVLRSGNEKFTADMFVDDEDSFVASDSDGTLCFDLSLQYFVGTDYMGRDFEKGKYYLRKSRELNNPEAWRILQSNDKEAEIYIAAAKRGNPVALNKLKHWYLFNKKRLPDEKWQEIGNIKKRFNN